MSEVGVMAEVGEGWKVMVHGGGSEGQGVVRHTQKDEN